MPLREDLFELVRSYQQDLARRGPEGRRDLVDRARRVEDWPVPQDRYLAGHAQKHGRGRRLQAYAQWANDIKNRPGVLVVGYIHPVKRNRGIAFIDHAEDVVVLVDIEQELNFDCFSPTEGTKAWLANKTAARTHWRLRDTER